MTLPLLAASSDFWIFGGGISLGVLLLSILLWQVFGRGPRRHRIYQKGRQFLLQGHWEEALAAVRQVLKIGSLSPEWEGRVRNLQGESQHAAGVAALKEQRFEEALRHFTSAAELLQLPLPDLRSRVIEAMLAEVMRLFAADSNHNQAVLALTARILTLAPATPAASFWQGLCHLREGQLEQAATALKAACQNSDSFFIDPPLYLGLVHLQLDHPQEALRFLAEANRVDPHCPLIALHMGLALVAAGGDGSLAVRALQRALGHQGLAQWSSRPQQLWTEGLPEGRSFVRRLAGKYHFTCPVVGDTITTLLHKGQLALGQAQYRLGHFQEAADLFAQFLQEAPPTVLALRGLGLALVKLERFDQAYKYLRLAWEQDPKDHLTAGYLGLCATLGKPVKAEDKPRNVAWAVRLVASFDVNEDPQWAGLCNRIFSEARHLGLAVGQEDLRRLCDLLVSVKATDREALETIAQLASTAPALLRSEHAWIYCRAVCQQRISGPCDLEMFTLTFRQPKAARDFFEQQGWDFEEVEYAFLERSAQAKPGGFPEVLGPDYSNLGTSLLLKRSERLSEAGDDKGARSALEALMQLAPANLPAYDRLARLCFLQGDLDRALQLLTRWHALDPSNYLPLARQAVLEQLRGNPADSLMALELSRRQASGSLRATLSFLGARLALCRTRDRTQKEPGNQGDGEMERKAREEAEKLLEECLEDQANHVAACWMLAALRSLRGDQAGLAALAPAFGRPEVPDPYFHFMGAVCYLAADDPRQAIEACRLAWGEPTLTVECRYLMGWAYYRTQDWSAARREWEIVGTSTETPSAPYARAMLGRILFEQKKYEEAMGCWQSLESERLRQWHLEEILPKTAFLAGLQALDQGNNHQAADRFRLAAQLGLEDGRLNLYLAGALIKSGLERLYPPEGHPALELE